MVTKSAAVSTTSRQERQEPMDILRNAGIVPLLNMLITLLPIVAAIAYVLRPSEQRLGLIRPVSMAALFAGLAGLVLGLINMLRYYWMNETAPNPRFLAVGTAESMLPLLTAFGSLTFAWLCVAARQGVGSVKRYGGTGA
jgi:hypothetical protein